MSINERIKDVRKSASLSQTDFAERLGTTRGVITNLEGGKTTPNEPFIKLICREFNVDEHWLRTGEGDMFQKLTRDQELAEFSVRSSLTRTMRRESVLSRSSASSAQRSGSCSTRSQKNGRGRLTSPALFYPRFTTSRKTATQCPVPFPLRFPASS